MGILWMIIIGLIAGAIAKLLMPGRDPGGIIVTILLGIAGSFVGGFLANLLRLGDGDSAAGLIGSVIGAMILLALYRVFVGRKHHDTV
ncbi:MAG: GlsB/YeaQ/YmgE family stress response membrane protein [Gemmatimonadota bacterium]|nr:GlsB/YeaQ/YmgE family stress response membrane protein [Gemmatimonadota bacterium]